MKVIYFTALIGVSMPSLSAMGFNAAVICLRKAP